MMKFSHWALVAARPGMTAEEVRREHAAEQLSMEATDDDPPRLPICLFDNEGTPGADEGNAQYRVGAFGYFGAATMEEFFERRRLAKVRGMRCGRSGGVKSSAGQRGGRLSNR